MAFGRARNSWLAQTALLIVCQQFLLVLVTAVAFASASAPSGGVFSIICTQSGVVDLAPAPKAPSHHGPAACCPLCPLAGLLALPVPDSVVEAVIAGAGIAPLDPSFGTDVDGLLDRLPGHPRAPPALSS